MQCADVDAADANSRRVKHVYSLHESNKAVIQRQMSEWAPVDMRVMPKQIKVIECPYGKSKAHIVLAHIFACEAFQTQPQPALGAQVVSNSDVGQTLALDWKLQCTDANPSPDRKVSAAPGVPNAASGQAQDRCADGASSQAEAGAQGGEDSSPESAIHSASAQHPEPAQNRPAGQRPAEEAAGEKQSGVDGEAPPEAPCSSAPLRPSRDPRLRPGRAPDAAKPGSTAAAAAVEVVDLISDSEDEHPHVAGPSHTARQTELATAKEDNPPSFVAGPVTPQRLPQALPASRRTDTAAQAAHAADTWQREAARVAPAAATAGTAGATPASRRKPQKVGRKPGRPAAWRRQLCPGKGRGRAGSGGGQQRMRLQLALTCVHRLLIPGREKGTWLGCGWPDHLGAAGSRRCRSWRTSRPHRTAPHRKQQLAALLASWQLHLSGRTRHAQMHLDCQVQRQPEVFFTALRPRRWRCTPLHTLCQQVSVICPYMSVQRVHVPKCGPVLTQNFYFSWIFQAEIQLQQDMRDA
jgi:hypothetical protein